MIPDPAAWLEADPDPATRAELQRLLDAGDTAAVEARFAAPLRFGTAGVRGALGPGPARMNRVVVRQVTAGVMEVLGPGSTVVVGRDARPNSDVFAEDVADIVVAEGGAALHIDPLVPTPVLAFSVSHLAADAGVMVTASHNPPGDNGYKLYTSDGAQILPPTADAVEQAVAARPLPPKDLGSKPKGRVRQIGAEIIDQYVAALAEGGPIFEVDPAHEPRVAYTALHGVGAHTLRAAFTALGIAHPLTVDEQDRPDGAFPTVQSPNPEHPDALASALGLGIERGADLVLANDPDADRLAVAVATADGFRTLNGNEIGALLADHVLASTSGDDRLVVSTVVSSTLVAKMAAANGVTHRQVLTGFKWIADAGWADPNKRFVFGYEEALGYAVGDLIRDKDGISAAAAFVALTSRLAAVGSDPLTRLHELGEEHGHHRTAQVVIGLGEESGGQRMARLRPVLPREIAGIEVVEIIDRLDPGGDVPPTDLVQLHLADGSLVSLRPSGTEPKLKIYLEAIDRDPDAADDRVARLAGAARALLD